MSTPYPEPQPLRSPEQSPTTTGLLERERVEQPVEPGDHERFAHYVNKNKVMESALTGEPVIAICGKVWIPNRNPKKFPVCPQCKEIYEGLKSGGDSGSDGGKG